MITIIAIVVALSSLLHPLDLLVRKAFKAFKAFKALLDLKAF